ncbi:MAG: hypothetical protein AAFX94_22845 [Myxococcota bacterium]
MRRRPLPFNIQRMLRDRNGLLTRLELAFALEPVQKLRAPPRRRREDTGDEPRPETAERDEG